MTVLVQAYAKINLFLDVTGKRDDGYHDILSLMQTVSLCDDVTVSLLNGDGSEITLECDSESVPCNEKNLAYRAAIAFFDAVGHRRSVHIAIKKRIPVSAGLAGGSTDAAAVLRALNKLCGEPFSLPELCTIGKTLGADIPFCLVGGTCEVAGIGELLKPLPPMPQIPIVVAKRGDGVSTPAAYRALDEGFGDFRGEYLGGTAPKDQYNALLTAFSEHNASEITKYAYNVFESVVLPEHPDATALREEFLNAGASIALMSGSGPAVLGVFARESDAQRIAARINAEEGREIAFAVLPIDAETARYITRIE